MDKIKIPELDQVCIDEPNLQVNVTVNEYLDASADHDSGILNCTKDNKSEDCYVFDLDPKDKKWKKFHVSEWRKDGL